MNGTELQFAGTIVVEGRRHVTQDVQERSGTVADLIREQYTIRGTQKPNRRLSIYRFTMAAGPAWRLKGKATDHVKTGVRVHAIRQSSLWLGDETPQTRPSFCKSAGHEAGKKGVSLSSRLCTGPLPRAQETTGVLNRGYFVTYFCTPQRKQTRSSKSILPESVKTPLYSSFFRLKSPALPNCYV